MKSRCNNPKATGFEFYGGKGITVCPAWQESFWNFYFDMGTRPDGHSLDRKDFTKGYFKDNCRWATALTQGNNKSDNVVLEHEGTSMNVSEWGRVLGILPNTIQYRLYRGWCIPEALGFEKHFPSVRRLISGDVLTYALKEFADGRSQSDIGRELGIHASQISRAFKTAFEKQITEPIP